MKQADDAANQAPTTASGQIPRTLGDAIRLGRNKLGLSQRALAAKISELGVPMDATAVTRLENNQREARLSEGIALSRFLGFDLFNYAPAGFSYAGLVAHTVASYKTAAECMVALLLDSAEALGMQNYLDDPVDRDEILTSLMNEIRDQTEVNGELQIGDEPVSALLAAPLEWERRGALMVLQHLVSQLGVGDSGSTEA
ncbi:helix-turn-helix transcriptional regulator [Rhodococcus sp. UFZ-B548]|uniref:helix-turn-helix domain-containing protein n=1 Tax=Rhodococcus sp. UFZ-B548 TaxID=2742212 RepID=UPI0015F3F592|nr:helix-turn-helix transcriptional regulator [Rhodococcus sp. UFZ-B548]